MPDFRRLLETLGAAAARAAESGAGGTAEKPRHPVTKALAALFDQLHASETAVSTNVLTSALEWRPVSEQQDVNEFWVMLHEHLNVEHENTANANLLNVFQGEYLWTMHCHGCKKNVSYRLEPFLNIELEVPRDGRRFAWTSSDG